MSDLQVISCLVALAGGYAWGWIRLAAALRARGWPGAIANIAGAVVGGVSSFFWLLLVSIPQINGIALIQRVFVTWALGLLVFGFWFLTQIRPKPKQGDEPTEPPIWAPSAPAHEEAPRPIDRSPVGTAVRRHTQRVQDEIARLRSIATSQAKAEKKRPSTRAAPKRRAHRATRVKFSYMNAEGDLSERTVDVQKAREEYFSGYCHLRQGTRTFRYDRVIGYVTDLETGEMLDADLWRIELMASPMLEAI